MKKGENNNKVKKRPSFILKNDVYVWGTFKAPRTWCARQYKILSLNFLFTQPLTFNIRNKISLHNLKNIKFMADNGFMPLEDNGMMGRTPELQTKIGETMAKLGMTMGVFPNWRQSWAQ
jgi:hypothetical protein